MAKRPIKTRHAALKIPFAQGKRNLGKVINKAAPLTKFVALFQDPLRSAETLREYLALPKPKQDDLKAAPGYVVGGHSVDGRRRRDSIVERSFVTIDADALSVDIFNSLLDGEADLPWAYMVHTTRKHTPEKPRARLFIFLDSPISAENYRPLALIMAARLDSSMEAFDPVSFRHTQLMYLPSVCRDQLDEFVCHFQERKAVADPSEVLSEWSERTGNDWNQYETLPASDNWSQQRKAASKAEDPREKKGVVGAFCRTYNIEAAIAEFELPYKDRTENGREIRYSYASGTTANGAVIYDDVWLYSNHATDPCSHSLCNAFDLVRRHLYRELDTKIDDPEEANPTSLPSYKKMVERFSKDEAVLAHYDESEDVDRELPFEQVLEEDAEPEHEPDDGKSEEGQETTSHLQKMNRKHAVVDHNGKALIITIKGKKIEYSGINDLMLLYRIYKMPNGKGGEYTMTEWWLEHPKRRTYWDGIEFGPGLDLGARVFNTWQGFAVKPDSSKSCARYIAHLRDNVCRGDDASNQYLIGWLADLVQNPARKPGVAVVLRGLKGVGKDVVGDYLEGLFPFNYFKTAQPEQLTGKFNGHHEKALLIHIEEGHWAGDKKAEGVLKSIITAPMTMIEKKGIDAIPMRSFSRILITSNETWAVPASRDDRRWAVFEVGADHKEDTAYFEAIMSEARNGGRPALLHFLLNYDLTGFDVRRAPNTEGLSLQKQASLKNVAAYWLSVLQAEEIPAVARVPGFNEDELPWREQGQRAFVDEFYNDYDQWHREHQRYGHGEQMDKTKFGRELATMCKNKGPTRRVGSRNDRRTAHCFPHLDQCRADFENWLGSKIDWAAPVEEDDLIG